VEDVVGVGVGVDVGVEVGVLVACAEGGFVGVYVGVGCGVDGGLVTVNTGVTFLVAVLAFNAILAGTGTDSVRSALTPTSEAADAMAFSSWS
jgi:hypothetical protein